MSRTRFRVLPRQGIGPTLQSVVADKGQGQFCFHDSRTRSATCCRWQEARRGEGISPSSMLPHGKRVAGPAFPYSGQAHLQLPYLGQLLDFVHHFSLVMQLARGRVNTSSLTFQGQLFLDAQVRSGARSAQPSDINIYLGPDQGHFPGFWW